MVEHDSKPLIAALRGGKRRRRSRAARAINKIRDRRTMKRLCALLEDPSDIVCIQAAVTIGDIGDPIALSKLELTPRPNNHHSAFGSVSKVFAEQASRLRTKLNARELQQDIKRLIKALKSPEASVRERAQLGLSSIGRPAVTSLIRVLGSGKNRRIKVDVIEVIGSMSEPDVRLTGHLVAMLRDPDPKVRQGAAFALRKHGDATAVEPLVTCLEDSDVDVQRHAVLALGYVGDERALVKLDQLSACLADRKSAGNVEIAGAAEEVATAIRKRV